MILNQLPNDEYLGELVREQLIYYPTVTRETFDRQGRITQLLASGELTESMGLPTIDPATDRFMVCGNPAMLKECCEWLNAAGFNESRHGYQAEYVIERAFVER